MTVAVVRFTVAGAEPATRGLDRANTVVFDGYGASDKTLSLILGTGDYRVEYTMPKIVGSGALAPVRVAGYRED